MKIPYLVIYDDKDQLYEMMQENNINVKIMDLPAKSFKNLIHNRKKVLRTRTLISKLVEPQVKVVFHKLLLTRQQNGYLFVQPKNPNYYFNYE